jgi:hypothetical protein
VAPYQDEGIALRDTILYAASDRIAGPDSPFVEPNVEAALNEFYGEQPSSFLVARVMAYENSQFAPLHACSRADIGLRGDELKSAGQLLPEQAASCLAVLMPPTGGFTDLTLGKGDDT